MSKVLIIADGILAKYFLQKVIESKISKNEYDIIYYHKDSIEIYKKENIKYYKFDPTSHQKLKNVLENKYDIIMIALKKKLDTLATYRNIRLEDKKIPVHIIDRWGLTIDDKYTYFLNTKKTIASRFFDALPNIPLVAQNVGLGEGEIMEMIVPIGSSFTFRQISSINQKNWKIIAIYRNNEQIIARPHLMIMPNDMILIIGKPSTLRSVYNSVNEESGQFPLPFGHSLYCILDMKTMSEKELQVCLNNAISLHAKLNNKNLIIKVINPTLNEIFYKIKKLFSKNIIVNIDYFSSEIKQTLRQDVSSKNIGMIIVTNKYFDKNKKALYLTKIPIFKSGKQDFYEIAQGVIIGNDAKETEKSTVVILDFCSQLELKVKLFFYQVSTKEKLELSERFESISKTFDKKVKIIHNDNKNPLLVLKNHQDIIQFVPFNKKILKSSIFDILSLDLNFLSHKLKDKYQVYMPTQD